MGRRALTATTMTVLVVLLAIAAYIGWKAISSPEGDQANAGQKHGRKCDAGLKKGDLVRSSEVTVSVYNAGTRTGLAGQTQDRLAARKFIRGDVGNAPSGFTGVQKVRVLARTANDPAARLVARQFGPRTVVQATKRNLGPGVDVVVGNDYSGLVKAPQQVKATANGSGC